MTSAVADLSPAEFGHREIRFAEPEMPGLACFPGVRWIQIKPQVDERVFPNGHSIIVLSEVEVTGPVSPTTTATDGDP